MLMPQFYNDWLPFHLLSDEELYDHINDIDYGPYFQLDVIDKMHYKQFDIDTNRYNSDINPDTCYYRGAFEIANDCKYYLPGTLNGYLSYNEFSVCSININSIVKNLDVFSDQCQVGTDGCRGRHRN